MKKSLVILAILTMAAPAMGLARWDGTGNWTDTTGLWTGTAPDSPCPPPSSGDSIDISSGQVTISSWNWSQGRLIMAYDPTIWCPHGPAGDAELRMTGGTLSISDSMNGLAMSNANIAITLSGSADFNANGEDFQMLHYGASIHTQYTNSTSTVTLNGVSTMEVAGVFYFGPRWGTPGPGNVFTVNLNHTSVLTLDGELNIREPGTATRTLNLDGGTLKIAGTNSSISTAIWITGIGGRGGTWGASPEWANDGNTYTSWNQNGYTWYQGDVELLYGDFDLDGDVDGVDFSHWQAGYPTASGSDLDHGDADGDGDTDGVDFGLWQSNYPTAAPAPLAESTAVPEPATLLVLCLGGRALFKRRQ